MNYLRVKRIGEHSLPTPQFESEGAAGLDLRANLHKALTLWPGDERLVPTGFSYAVQPGYAGLLVPRSGLGFKHGIVLGNLVGVLDSDFRGELMVALWYRRQEGQPFTIYPGDRIAQLVMAKLMVSPVMDEVDELDDTKRGSGGFGSSGRS